MSEVFAKLEVIFARVRECWKDASGLLARLTGPQLQEVKHRFRGVITSDHLERLAMYGQGKLSPYLALPEKTLPASLLKRLPQAILDALNNPDREVEVWRTDGKVFIKRLGQLSQMELEQVINQQGNILSADAQRKRFLALAKRSVDNPQADELVFDGLTMGAEGEAVLYWRHDEDQPGTKRYAGAVPIKTLRSILR
jgi:hypothetical protein